jgi:hypothetical protein
MDFFSLTVMKTEPAVPLVSLVRPLPAAMSGSLPNATGVWCEPGQTSVGPISSVTSCG